MLKKFNNAENPPITSNKIFWSAFAVAYCLLLKHNYDTVRTQGILPAAAYTVINVLCFAAWVYFRQIAKPKKLAANRNSERIFGSWLTFSLLLSLLMHTFAPASMPKTLLLLLLTLLFAALLAFFFVTQETKLLYTEQKIETPKLGCDRLRIVHITDIHAGRWAGAAMLHELVETVNETQPDVIVCTGDLKDEKLGAECSEELTTLSRLDAKYGKFVTLGCHDYANRAETVEFAEQCGFTVLNGRIEEARGVMFAGCGDRDHLIKQQWGLTKSELLILSCEFVQKQSFLVVLRHRPLLEDGQQTHFDLQLSGAKHGITPFRLLLRKFGLAPGKGRARKCKQGGLLYTTDGAGYIGIPARVFCKPEVAVIDLVKTADGD